MKIYNNSRFGSLTVIEEVQPSKDKHKQYLCKCDCGNIKIVYGTKLRNGKITSCKSCSLRKASMKHGLKYTKEYEAWLSIKRRCNNKQNKYYGGSGIRMCEEWASNPAKFCSWYKENYKEGCTIDRIDNSKGYSPDNCRFATLEEQGSNKRNNVLITHDGKTKIASQWARIIGITPEAMCQRYKRHGNVDKIFKKEMV